MRFTPTCCNVNATWVDNVPTKEYWYCRSCKNEVDPSRLFVYPNSNDLSDWEKAVLEDLLNAQDQAVSNLHKTYANKP